MENPGSELAREFGWGYGWHNRFNIVRFAGEFSDRQILQTLSAILSWRHFSELFRVDAPLPHAFYTERTRLHHWGARPLRELLILS